MKEIVDDTIGLKCKKGKYTPKKERESTQMFSTSSLRSAVFFIRLCRIVFARYRYFVTRSQKSPLFTSLFTPSPSITE